MAESDLYFCKKCKSDMKKKNGKKQNNQPPLPPPLPPPITPPVNDGYQQPRQTNQQLLEQQELMTLPCENSDIDSLNNSTNKYRESSKNIQREEQYKNKKKKTTEKKKQIRRIGKSNNQAS